MFYKKFSYSLLLFLLLAQTAQAELAVVVNVDNKEALNIMQIRNLYLGKIHTFPSGAEVTVLAQPEHSPAFNEFLSKVLQRSAANLNAYWARMLFSSRGSPPRVISSPDKLLKLVQDNPNAIAYVLTSDIKGAKVRIVETFQ